MVVLRGGRAPLTGKVRLAASFLSLLGTTSPLLPTFLTITITYLDVKFVSPIILNDPRANRADI